MKAKYIYTYFSLTILLTNCSNDSRQYSKVRNDNFVENNNPYDAKVQTFISMDDTTIKYGERVVLNISLRNNLNHDQFILFDKPNNGFIWKTRCIVTDKKSNKSVLSNDNIASQSSQTYEFKELLDKDYQLKPNDTLFRKLDINHLVIFDNEDNRIPKGVYDIQLFYCDSPSNIISLRVK